MNAINNLRRVSLSGGEEILIKLWLTHRLQYSEQWPKPHAHSDMNNEINTGQRWGVFLEGIGFQMQYI